MQCSTVFCFTTDIPCRPKYHRVRIVSTGLPTVLLMKSCRVSLVWTTLRCGDESYVMSQDRCSIFNRTIYRFLLVLNLVSKIEKPLLNH